MDINTELPPAEEPPWLSKVMSRLNTIDARLNDIDGKMTTVNDTMKNLDTKLTELSESVEHAANTAEEALGIANANKVEISDLQTQNTQLQKDVTQLQKKILDFDVQSRRSNLIFDGITEIDSETWDKTEEILKQILAEKMDIMDDIKFERVNRIGKKIPEKPRPIIAKFHSFKDRNIVWTKRNELQGTSIWISEDYPQPIKANRRKLMPFFLAARKCEQTNNVSLRLDKLEIDGKHYTVDSVNDIPSFIHLNSKSTVTTDEVTVFSSKNSVLSNLHLLDIMIDGRIFNCNEQFIQHSKALLFKDAVKADEILKELDPYKQMELGKKVNGYRKQTWDAHAPRILNRVNREKFAQHKNAREILLATGTRKLGEATKHPTFGIGLNINDDNVTDSSKWKGQNVMGNTLHDIRSHWKT